MARNRGAGNNARPRRTKMGARWKSWRHHHGQSAAESLSRVLQKPLSSLMTWLVIGIAIALPAGLWLVLDNVQGASTRMESPAQLSVFLQASVTVDEAQRLAGELRARGDISSVTFVDRDRALEDFVADSALGDLAAHLPDNPLPHLLLLTPAQSDEAAVEALRGELLPMDAVDELVVDAQWLVRLRAVMDLGRRAVQLLAALLLVAVVLVLGNTIRLEIENRRDEIVIVKLVGGSNAFARRPLLYTGLWFGLGGGAFAAILVLLGTAILAMPVEVLATAYDSDFQLRGLGLVDSLQLVLIGAGLGLVGAWLAVFRHLRAIEPD